MVNQAFQAIPTIKIQLADHWAVGKDSELLLNPGSATVQLNELGKLISATL